MNNQLETFVKLNVVEKTGEILLKRTLVFNKSLSGGIPEFIEAMVSSPMADKDDENVPILKTKKIGSCLSIMTLLELMCTKLLQSDLHDTLVDYFAHLETDVDVIDNHITMFLNTCNMIGAAPFVKIMLDLLNNGITIDTIRDPRYKNILFYLINKFDQIELYSCLQGIFSSNYMCWIKSFGYAKFGKGDIFTKQMLWKPDYDTLMKAIEFTTKTHCPKWMDEDDFKKLTCIEFGQLIHLSCLEMSLFICKYCEYVHIKFGQKKHNLSAGQFWSQHIKQNFVCFDIQIKEKFDAKKALLVSDRLTNCFNFYYNDRGHIVIADIVIHYPDAYYSMTRTFDEYLSDKEKEKQAKIDV
jgi:hypothetical protein